MLCVLETVDSPAAADLPDSFARIGRFAAGARSESGFAILDAAAWDLKRPYSVERDRLG